MSVELRCPNCMRIIGDDDMNGNVRYYYQDKKENPICPTCGSGGNEKNILIAISCILLFIGIGGIICELIFGQ